MAKKDNGAADDDGRETRKHNVAHRQKLIREAHSKLIDLEAQRQAINDDIREVRKHLKGDTGITLKYFDRMRELHDLEADELAKAQDDMREAWEALNPGETVDWIIATEPAEDQPSA